jgi:hypothetical protein
VAVLAEHGHRRVATLSVTPSATTIENGLMLPAWLAVDRGPDDQPDLIVADNTYYQYFEGRQVSLKRYSTSRRCRRAS